MEAQPKEVEESLPTNECQECNQSFKTVQGLAGHRRLTHSASTARELDERNRELEAHRRALEQKATELARAEEATKRKEAEVTRRKREIERTGPRSIGLAQCDECGAWFDNSSKLQAHSRSVHPIDERVASEVGVSRERVNDVWTEACHKAERHPDESLDHIVTRFWSGTDQKILRALLAQDASFQFEEED